MKSLIDSLKTIKNSIRNKYQRQYNQTHNQKYNQSIIKHSQSNSITIIKNSLNSSRKQASKVINQRQVTCWYHLILLVAVVDQVAFVCCLHKSHIHLSWREIWINFDACHVFGEIAINVSTLLFSIFIVFHHDTQTYDFLLWITWIIYDIIFPSDISFLFFLLFEIHLVGFFHSSFKHRTIESHVPKLIALSILGLKRNLLLSSFIIIFFLL